MDLSFYKGKKVLVTGHTGFKGAWLTEMLLRAGAEVTGFALEPETEPNLFSELFTEADRKTTLVGIFLAILELTRHGYAYVSQDVAFGDITVSFRENSKPFDLLYLKEFDYAQAG